jgi:hypothetical protein
MESLVLPAYLLGGQGALIKSMIIIFMSTDKKEYKQKWYQNNKEKVNSRLQLGQDSHPVCA